MKYKVHPDGSIETDSLEEAIRVSAALSGKKAQQVTEPKAVKNGYVLPTPAELKARAIAFLATLVDAGQRGLTSEEFAAKLGLNETRALGGLMGSVKAQLKKKGFASHEEVFQNSEEGDTRRWVAKTRIAEALAKIGGQKAMEGLLTK